MYSYRIEQAIRAAAILHKDQLRKGSVPLPYITHLIATTLILRDYTDDEDTIVAALLHDTIEDTDYTAEELREDFGENVHRIVTALSEPQSSSQQEISWLEQKKAYATQLKKAPAESLMIAAADKCHNMRAIVEEYLDDHSRFVADFGGKLEQRIQMYQDIANVLNNRLENAILHEFNHVFSEYKQFVYDVQQSQR